MTAVPTAPNALVTALEKDLRLNLSVSALLYVSKYVFLTMLGFGAVIIIKQYLFIVIVAFFNKLIASYHYREFEYSHRLLTVIMEIVLTVHQKYVNQCNTIISMCLFLDSIFGLNAPQVKIVLVERKQFFF